MACDFLSLAMPGIQKLSPYVPGKPVEELAREYNLDPASIIKLASNENPMGPGSMALEAARRELVGLPRYPDGNGFLLKQALLEHLGIALNRITLGNGSNDVIDLVARTYLGPGRNAVFSRYAFAVYAIATQSVGAECREVPDRDWGHDLEAMLAAIDTNTAVVFIANPNNPTGTWFTAEAFDQFMQRLPENVLVVLDEAYIEYAEDDSLPDGLQFVSRYRNLLVSRTFSKAYGLAALRVGYGVSDPEVAETLNRARQPFNANSLALAAAAAALGDKAYLEKSRDCNRLGMEQLEKGLKTLGLSWIPSRGNFIAVDTGRDGMQVFQQLLKQGIILRPLNGYGMPAFLRITVGLPEENALCLDALGRVLNDV